MARYADIIIDDTLKSGNLNIMIATFPFGEIVIINGLKITRWGMK